MLPMGGVETHGGGSRGAEAAHHQRKGRRTGGHGKGPALRRPGQQGAQQGGDGRREVSS
ncbi:MAG: hypothetical protein ACLTLK_06980 [Oscillospiraceae bacterium]